MPHHSKCGTLVDSAGEIENEEHHPYDRQDEHHPVAPGYLSKLICILCLLCRERRILRLRYGLSRGRPGVSRRCDRSDVRGGW